MTNDVVITDHFKTLTIATTIDLDSNNDVIVRLNSQIEAINVQKPLLKIEINTVNPTTINCEFEFADGKKWESLLKIPPDPSEFTVDVPDLLPESVLSPMIEFIRTLTGNAIKVLEFTSINVNY